MCGWILVCGRVVNTCGCVVIGLIVCGRVVSDF